MRPRIRAFGTAVGLLAVVGMCLLLLGGNGTGGTLQTQLVLSASTPPATTLGVWNGSPGSIPNNQHPNVLNDYYYWGNQDFSFLAQSYSKGATPFVEFEPWKGGGTSDCQNGLFASIASNNSSAVTYAKSFGSAVASLGKPVIFTFAHEMNIGGQYPWSTGNGCGVTASQWIQAWKNVVNNIKSTANGFAYSMWAPNVDPNGNDTGAAKYWPGPGTVDMTGVDGYPAFCSCGGTFGDIYGGTFKEIQGLSGFGSLPRTQIFISETDNAPLGSGGFESTTNFIKDMCAAGGDGFLQFQDGTPAMSNTQWSDSVAALAKYCSAPTPAPTPTQSTTAPAPTPTAPTPSQTSSGGSCPTATATVTVTASAASWSRDWDHDGDAR